MTANVGPLDQECLCRIVPSQSPSGSQQPPQMAPQGWQISDLNQSHHPFAPSGAPQASYPSSNQGHGQAGFPHASRPNPPFQSHFDQIPPNTVLPDKFGQQTFPAAVQQPFFTPYTSAVERHPVLSTVANHGEGTYTPSDQPKASCCSSKKSSNQNLAERSKNQDVISEMLHGSPQTTIYRIPAGLATYDNPMKPEQQVGFGQSNPDYIQTVPAYAESGVMGTTALPADTNETADCIVATTHHCHCGTGCQCVACPVHPGNATTQAKVAEMYDLLDNEPPYTPTFETNPPWSPSQGTNGNMAVASYQTYTFQMPPDQEVLGPQPDFGSHQAGQHWSPPTSSPPAQFSPPGSDQNFASYPHNMTDMNNLNGNNDGNNATPSQKYLHFQYPLPYVNGQ